MENFDVEPMLIWGTRVFTVLTALVAGGLVYALFLT